MAFIKNTWYAAAWASEVSTEMMCRKIIGESVLLFRKESGVPVAMGDTCPHRFAKLHKGKIKDDIVECPYHGLQFNTDGQCIHNPHGDGKISAAAKVRSWPVVERNKLIWIWAGAAETADPDSIPDFSILEDDSQYDYTAGHVIHIPANYSLLLDNLMDLTHAAYLHPENLGSEAVARGTMDVEVNGNNITTKNFYPNGLPAPVFSATGAVSADQMVDYWVDVHWQPPGQMYFDGGVTPTGESRKVGSYLRSIQIVTPETENSSHYLWCMFRNYQRDNPDLTTAIEAAVTKAFTTEDEPMIVDVDERMEGKDFWDMKPVLLQTDAAAVRLRRTISSMLAAEAKEDSSQQTTP